MIPTQITAVLASARAALDIPNLTTAQRQSIANAHIKSLPPLGLCSGDGLVLRAAVGVEIERLANEEPSKTTPQRTSTPKARPSVASVPKDAKGREHPDRRSEAKPDRNTRRKASSPKAGREG